MTAATDDLMGGSTLGDSLNNLLAHLQGNGPKIEAAAGLARFGDERLQAIHRGARVRSKDCLNGVQTLSRLLALILEQPDIQQRRAELMAAVEQLMRLASDLECWQDLADNAAYYGERRDVAAQVATLWARAAHLLGELPMPDAKPG
jgi:hypothetical protein